MAKELTKIELKTKNRKRKSKRKTKIRNGNNIKLFYFYKASTVKNSIRKDKKKREIMDITVQVS